MENIFNPVYRHDYMAGYSNGLNPNLRLITEKNDAFNSGFIYGRMEYERMNGFILDGIPQLTLTIKILEEFLLAGMLGMDIDASDYTPFQMQIIEKWYESGIEKYDPNQNIYLMAILERNSILI